jgi:HD superfamily phosphohydrolase
MQIHDPIYGTFQVAPVIESLMLSRPFQRLKKVHQGGAIFLVDPAMTQNRFDHSLGVFALVQKFGGSIQEQIAALLHDVSHTAFSHVTDYVFANKAEDYHEAIFDKVIENSEIPAILEQYGFSTAILTDMDSYRILEMPLPHLCADRLDYTLRDLLHIGAISQAETQVFLNSLTLHAGTLAVNSQETADWITEQYRFLNEAYFGKKEHVYANLQLAEILKVALANGQIVPDDLLQDDFELLDQLRLYPELAARISALENLEGLADFVPQQKFKERILKPEVHPRK